MRIWPAVLCLAWLAAGAAQAQTQPNQLHDALHLSAAQEEAWRSYQRAVAPDPQQTARAQQTAAMLPTLPTPRRLALIRAQMQSDLAALERQAAAVDSFYAQLDPDQQRTFDRQTAPNPAQR